MECFEVDTKLIAYVNHQLNDDDLEGLLDHINRCDKCRREVELFYMLTEGMNQMESKQIQISDYPEEFEKTRKLERFEIKERKRIRHYTDRCIMLFVAVMVIFGILYGMLHIETYQSQLYSIWNIIMM